MNYVKRIIFSFAYHIKSNVLLILVYFIVAVLFISSYSVRSSAIASIEDMRENIGALVFVSKKDSISDIYDVSVPFSYDIGKEIANLPQVKQERYYSEINVEGIDIKGGFPPIFLTQENQSIYINDILSLFPIKSITNTQEHWDFQQEINKLLKGRFLTSEDEDKPYAIISTEVATDNSFDIGDKFSVRSNLYKEVIIELEIVGIYSAYTSPLMISNYNFFNIYTPMGIAAKLNNGEIMEATFVLNHVYDVKSFIDEASEISKKYGADLTFYDQNLDFLAASRPMNSLVNLCNMILFSVILMVASGNIRWLRYCSCNYLPRCC